jgi:hypothetical protein
MKIEGRTGINFKNAHQNITKLKRLTILENRNFWGKIHLVQQKTPI